MIAFLEARRAGLFTRENLLNNVIAGVIVGVVALPLAMAFAIASGLKPEQGIYTAIIAGAAVSVFGGSRVQIAGPTGAFIVLLSGITAKYGYDGLQVATLLAGLILFALGATKLGSIIRFVPAPVVTGFTAGIGVIIFVGQWKDFLGLQPEKAGAHFHSKLYRLVEALPHFHPATTALALLSLALVIVTPKLFRRVPGPLVAMLAATVLESVYKFDGVATIGSAFGGIPAGLPPLSLPDISLGKALQMVGPAFAIAGLGAIESLLSATVADGMTGKKHSSNQELMGQGVANILCPLFSGFTATGAIARTATNIRSGANSPLAGIVHSALLLLIILVLSPLAENIPLCALAAILFVVAYNMSEARRFAGMIRHAPRNDIILLLLTFFLTVFVDLVVAVNVGVILAALMFMRRMMDSVHVDRQGEEMLHRPVPAGVAVFTVEGPLFFGAVETFERALEIIDDMPRTVILSLRSVPFIDVAGIESLEAVIGRFRARGVRVILCGMNARVQGKLTRAAVLWQLGRDNVFPLLEKALEEAAAGEIVQE